MRLIACAWCLTWLCLPASGFAAVLDDSAMANATGSLLTLDYLRERCPEASRPPLSNDIAAWERENRVAQLRVAVEAARARPGGDARLQEMRAALGRLLAPVAGHECDMLRRWLAAPESKVAGQFDGGGGATQTPVAKTANVAPAGSSEIQGYSLIQGYGTGYGGMITIRLEPVVLFKSGDLLTDLAGLSTPGGALADRRIHPAHWSQWRRNGSTYQYRDQDGSWATFYQNKVWTSQAVAALQGRYVRVGGTGSLATGGTDAVFSQSSFDFQPGGRVLREGFAGASASAGNGASSVTSGGRATPRVGRYVVKDLGMAISYDDGASERLTLMTHPSDPNIIWIDGLEYTRRH